MKYGLTLLLSLVCLAFVAAQAPSNDDCDNAVNLGVAPNCDATTFYSNVDATASDIGDFNIPACFVGGSADRDVWFTFMASDTIDDYTIRVIGAENGETPAMLQPQIVIYRGACVENGLAELQFCATAEEGSNEVRMDLSQLTLGVTYFIRVNDWSATAAPNAGAFNICIEETPPINTIDGGGSTACSGFIYDTGGPDGNYEDDENFVYEICPSQPHQCIQLDLTFYNMQNNADGLIIYDGDAATGTVIADIGGAGFVNDTESGGAVCFTAYASTGCMTLEFQSDASINFEGFEGFWQCSTTPCELPQPVTVDVGVAESELIDALTGPQAQVSNVTLNCSPTSYGVFNALGSDLGLEEGVLLTTGGAQVAIGPNDSPSDQEEVDEPFNAGDPDLDSLNVIFGGDPILRASEDACVLEFDVFVNTEELVFEYIFGSEEYPEFTDSDFNDIFAFLISGDGITGVPALNNQENIAVLPNDDATPVQILSVNNELNWEFYRNNEVGLSVQYDGLTSGFMGTSKSLTARSPVTPCETYRLKLAIADRGDNNYDSGVFISDLRGGSPEIAIQFNNGIDYFLEDCTSIQDSVVFFWDNPRDNTLGFAVQISGSATNGDDYLLDLPDSLFFAPGPTRFAFPISLLTDMEVEGPESIIISLLTDFGCGEVVAAALETTMQDDIQLEIIAEADTLTFCEGIELAVSATGVDEYFWQPPAIFSDPFAAETTVLPNMSQEISVIGSVGMCMDTASIFLNMVVPELEIIQGDTIPACTGDTLVLNQTNNLIGADLLWEPDFYIEGPENLDSVVLAPTFSDEISITATLGACTLSDTIFVDFNAVTAVTIIEDTVICQGTTIVLADAGFNNGQTTFLWDPADVFDDPNDPESPVFVDSTTVFSLARNSANGVCNDTFMVEVEVIPADLEITNGDTVSLCLGAEPITLFAATDPAGTEPFWYPQVDNISDSLGNSFEINPQQTTQYFATYEANSCPRTDSIWVTVDSLPNMEIMADEFKDPYCPGDTFFLISPIYDVFDFPRITHSWSMSPGLQTPDSLYNGYVIAQDSSLFTRINTNGACRDTSTIQINVIPPPDVEITPDTTICIGESVQLNFMVLDPSLEGTLTWTPETGLSCTSCPDPVATPTGSTTYQVELETEEGECPFTFSVNITVQGPPMPLLADDPVICSGDDLVLLLNNPEPGTTYSISGGGVNTDDPLSVLSPTENTTYTFTAMNDCGMFSQDIEVRVIQQATLTTMAPTEACTGDPVTLSAATVASPGTPEVFIWTVDGTTVSTDPDYNFIATESVVVNLEYSTPCQTETESFNITVFPAPSLQTPGDITVCQGSSVILNSDVSPVTTYSWSGSDGFSSTDAAPTVMPSSTTTYSVTATTPNCTAVEESFTITVIEPYTVDAGDNQIYCAGSGGLSLSAAVDPAGTPGTYTWTDQNGAFAGEGATINIDPTETATYTVTFVDDANCFTGTDMVMVEVVDELPFLDLIAEDEDGNLLLPNDSVFIGDQITFTAGRAPEGFTYTYEWTGNGEPATGTGQSIIVTAIREGDLTYSVTATSNLAGCTVSNSFLLRVFEAQSLFPDLISPNNDGRNDLFRLFYNGEVNDYNLTVYNRWGQEVFSTSDPDQGWDGTVDGTAQTFGTYLYIATFNQNGMNMQLDGQFSLIR
ncbi:MAG: choice-of-anchor L domain-containing protein [Bacteroidota bacterium]